MIPGKTHINFKYLFPSDLRDIHINGAYGSVDQGGNICMSLFNERRPVPTQITQSLDEHGRLGGIADQQEIADVIRVVQVSAVMSVGTAMAIRDWLDERIKYVAENQKIREDAKEGLLH